MSPKDDRRAVTLSISMSPELSAEVSSRVQSGLYSSASEVLREALRLLIRTEGDRGGMVQSLVCEGSPASTRFEEASELMDLGLKMQADKLRREAPDLASDDVLERLNELADKQDAGPGLRVAVDRLDQLKLK